MTKMLREWTPNNHRAVPIDLPVPPCISRIPETFPQSYERALRIKPCMPLLSSPLFFLLLWRGLLSFLPCFSMILLSSAKNLAGDHLAASLIVMPYSTCWPQTWDALALPAEGWEYRHVPPHLAIGSITEIEQYWSNRHGVVVIPSYGVFFWPLTPMDHPQCGHSSVPSTLMASGTSVAPDTGGCAF